MYHVILRFLHDWLGRFARKITIISGNYLYPKA